MRATESGFNPCPPQRPLAIGIILHGRGLEHLHEGDAHALGNGGDVFQHWHAYLVYRKMRLCFASPLKRVEAQFDDEREEHEPQRARRSLTYEHFLRVASCPS